MPKQKQKGPGAESLVGRRASRSVGYDASRRFRRLHPLICVVATIGLNGCVSTRLLSVEALQPKTEVRVTLLETTTVGIEGAAEGVDTLQGVRELIGYVEFSDSLSMLVTTTRVKHFTRGELRWRTLSPAVPLRVARLQVKEVRDRTAENTNAKRAMVGTFIVLGAVALPVIVLVVACTLNPPCLG